MNGRVAIVIPAYNAENTIAATLHALRPQAGPVDAEVIVVDNASTDETALAARELGAIVVRETRRGPSAARNRGIASTSADIIVHLDADTIPSRRWLSSMVAPFENKSTVLVAGNTQCYPPQTPAERYVARSGLYDTSRAISRTPFPFAPSLNMAVRRYAALAIGGWAEDLMTGEDVDFSHRIIKRYGTDIVYAPDALLYHRTRSDRRALVHQARTYGEGAGHLFRRYPDELAWDATKTRSLGSQMVGRLVARLSTRIALTVGRADVPDVEFADYHWFWTSNYWLGFLRAYRMKEKPACA
jgi:glycosyltransferase involved in cell wall biosynthesis